MADKNPVELFRKHYDNHIKPYWNKESTFIAAMELGNGIDAYLTHSGDQISGYHSGPRFLASVNLLRSKLNEEMSAGSDEIDVPTGLVEKMEAYMNQVELAIKSGNTY